MLDRVGSVDEVRGVEAGVLDVTPGCGPTSVVGGTRGSSRLSRTPAKTAPAVASSAIAAASRILVRRRPDGSTDSSTAVAGAGGSAAPTAAGTTPATV